MAVHCRIQRRTDISCMVLWVIVTIASGVDCSSSFATDTEVHLLPAHTSSDAYHKLKRAAEDESLQQSTSSENPDLDIAQEELDETLTNNERDNSESLISEEINKQPDSYEEPKKSKPTNKQKYLGNEFKTSNKVSLEMKKSNVNSTDKQILDTQEYQSKPGYINKKDIKSNNSFIDFKANYSNPAVPNINSLENKQNKVDVEKESGPTSESEIKVEADPEAVRLNDTLVMNDQPQPVELPLNTSSTVNDFSDDESLEDVLLQNTTDVEDHTNTTNADGRTMPASEGVDFAVISGITLGTLVLLGLFAGGGFVIYRHRMWNKPQTLSDKCSNADSSGYIDDSTLRENSEEMYSLDNDSFLNSLEAMTIQNYWTDNVKHTKL